MRTECEWFISDAAGGCVRLLARWADVAHLERGQLTHSRWSVNTDQIVSLLLRVRL